MNIFLAFLVATVSILTHFHACVGCEREKQPCDRRQVIKDAIAGLRVRSVRHVCTGRSPLYTPGCAVLVKTVAWTGSKPDYDPEDGPPICWYRATFIEQCGPKALAYIPAGRWPTDDDGDYAFEPQGNGMVKVPLSRMKPLDGIEPVDVTPCQCCSAITSIGQRCGQPGDLEYGLYGRPGLCQERKAEVIP